MIAKTCNQSVRVHLLCCCHGVSWRFEKGLEIRASMMMCFSGVKGVQTRRAKNLMPGRFRNIVFRASCAMLLEVESQKNHFTTPFAKQSPFFIEHTSLGQTRNLVTVACKCTNWKNDLSIFGSRLF